MPTIAATTWNLPGPLSRKPAISKFPASARGTADSDNPALLALSDTGMGSEKMLASGVGVEILDEDQDAVSINNTSSVVYPLKTGRNTLSFYIRYKSTRPTVTSGNATAVMYFDLQYE